MLRLSSKVINIHTKWHTWEGKARWIILAPKFFCSWESCVAFYVFILCNFREIPPVTFTSCRLYKVVRIWFEGFCVPWLVKNLNFQLFLINEILFRTERFHKKSRFVQVSSLSNKNQILQQKSFGFFLYLYTL